jgi:hypothetical protein
MQQAKSLLLNAFGFTFAQRVAQRCGYSKLQLPKALCQLVSPTLLRKGVFYFLPGD